MHSTASGSYLAARHAGVERDSETAAAYYLNVLKADPRNADLLSRTFLSVLTDGDIDEAGRLADRLIQLDRTDRIARLVIGVRALKQKQYAIARQNFAQSVRGPVTDLTAALLGAWAMSGAGDSRAAVETLDKLTGPDWYAIFKDTHAGLILDVASNKKEAGKRYERAYKADPVALRTVAARVIAGPRSLELDHLGPEVGQHRRRRRCRDHRRAVQNAHAAQRSAVRHQRLESGARRRNPLAGAGF